MTHPRWKILQLDPAMVDLSRTAIEDAFQLILAEGDLPVVIGSSEEAAFISNLPKFITECHPGVMWVAIPTEILKQETAWYVWGHNCIVISQGA